MAQTEYRGLTADTKRLLQGQEGREVDFELAPGGVKAELFVALANARGGSILIGVDEEVGDDGIQRGSVAGCPVDDKVRQGLISSAASCRPLIDIEIRIENLGTKKPIFRIDVPEGANKPYCTSSGTYKIRAEGQNTALDPSMIRAMILEQESDQFVARFKAAADELLKQVNQVHTDLAEQIQRVKQAADEATNAAYMAEQAGRDAEQAAIEAGMWAAAS